MYSIYDSLFGRGRDVGMHKEPITYLLAFVELSAEAFLVATISGLL